MKSFYTYIHCKPDGTPFYVGKGHGKRANDLNTRRNPHHKNIVEKYGKENIQIFVFPCDSEDQAFSDEKQHILQLRKDGYILCNLTDGGEGANGAIVSSDTKEKISIGLEKLAWKRRIDLTGKIFGAWNVVKFYGLIKVGLKVVKKAFWICNCACGTVKNVEGSSLRTGLSVGCGCTKRDAISKAQMGSKKGVKQSPDHIAKRVAKQIGKPWSDARRESFNNKKKVILC